LLHMAETRVNPIRNKPTANARPITEVKTVARPKAMPNPRVKVGANAKALATDTKLAAGKARIDTAAAKTATPSASQKLVLDNG
jgi:hypothetical protein